MWALKGQAEGALGHAVPAQWDMREEPNQVRVRAWYSGSSQAPALGMTMPTLGKLSK